MAAEGMPVAVIQAVMSYEKSSRTLDIYTRVAPRSQLSVLELEPLSSALMALGYSTKGGWGLWS